MAGAWKFEYVVAYKAKVHPDHEHVFEYENPITSEEIWDIAERSKDSDDTVVSVTKRVVVSFDVPRPVVTAVIPDEEPPEVSQG